MLELTTSQHNIWNLQRFYEGTSISNVCGAIFFDALCDHSLLNRALGSLIRRQDGMRLRFCEVNGAPCQYVAEYEEQTFPSLRFESREAFEEYAARYAKLPYEMTDGPMYRFVIFDVPDRTGILMCVNHLIADAWAVSLMAHEVSECYETLVRGGEAEVKEGSYLHFLEAEKSYLTSARYQKDEAFWAEQYPVRPEISYIRPGSAPADKPNARRYTAVLPTDLSAQLDAFCASQEVSQAVVFEAAIMAYLHRINPENAQTSLGVLILNRSGAREKQAVGTCISTMPLTVPVTGQLTFSALLQQITTAHMSMFRHQRYPYSHVLHALHERYGFTGNLYDVMVSFQNAQTGARAATKWFSNGFCEVGLEFHIDNRDDLGAYTINMDYQTALFRHEEEVALLLERIVHILRQMMACPDGTVEAVSILPEGEMQRVIRDFNDTVRPYERDKCVQELFEAQVRRTPERTALVFEDRRFTYAQLDEMSNALAYALRAHGVKPGEIVPIVSRRSWHVMVAMLGIMKAGGAFMHVDIKHPKERIDYMFETAGCRLALTYDYHGQIDAELLAMEDFDFSAHTGMLDLVNRPEDLCYVVFTSGSTGKPKGLMIAHYNFANFAQKNDLNVVGKTIREDGLCMLATSSMCFDASMTETLMPLLNGMTVYFANDEQALSQTALSAFFERGPIRVMEATPTKMRIFIADKNNVEYLKGIRTFILGGEELTHDLYHELRSLTDAAIVNQYGPAETTVWSTIKPMTDDDITVGRPIANTQVYILDAQQRPLPIGVAGEICIAGDGVGLGYVGRPELTAERYLPDPFIKDNRMYRTGDLARWRVDGEIEYLGRIDTQIKIRGLRIELGEIESAMSAFPGVRLSAVTDKRDETNRQYLVGYYTSDEEIDEKALRAVLSAQLPQYMVPHFLMRLDEMPMTASGKTDRKLLPLPSFERAERVCAAPETEMEKTLCSVLRELMQTQDVGVTDNFFDLGGDSLMAIEYVARAHSRGVSFALQNVFDYPTVRALSKHLTDGGYTHTAYDRADFEKYAPLLHENVPDDTFVPVRRDLGRVLVTGATGYLGAHVVDELLQAGAECVYCLVRGGEERLQEILRYYFDDRYAGEVGRRIVAVEGDITRPELADALPEQIDTVIHTAATVKHYGSYAYFHEVNTLGTQHVVSYAQRASARLIHISTISVSGNSLVDAFDGWNAGEDMDFTEQDLYVSQPLENVYIRSKFEAERLVMDAALQGYDCKIVRVGNLTNRTTDFRFQRNYQSNAFLRRVKAAVEFGCLPDYMTPLYAEFSPVDQTAQGVVLIAQYAARQTIFHLNNPCYLYFDRMAEILRQLDVPFRITAGEEFNAALQALNEHPDTQYIYQAFQNDLDENGRLSFESNIRIVNDFTVWFMRRLGFEWVQIDYDYIRGYIEYFRGIGYLEV